MTDALENPVLHDDSLIKEASVSIALLKTEIHKQVIGQDHLIENLIIGLISGGHILLEGVPGLAKTLTISTLSRACDVGFQRIQFTPDLLPSDVIGSEIFTPEKGTFTIKKGPIFSNFVLADEINRAPAKVQSALLEAMAERQVTIGNETFSLENPFLVLATQNPIEQSGVYHLPEAQMDRFLMKTIVNYPSRAEEIEMYQRYTQGEEIIIKPVLTKPDLLMLQKLREQIYTSPLIFEYVGNIIDASRNPSVYGLEKISSFLKYGFSPRAGLSLIHCAKAKALIESRSYVIPEDIKSSAYDVLNHRIHLSYEAIASDITAKDVIDLIFSHIKVS